MNVYQIAKSYAEDIMAEREYWSEDDLYDICHEHADGSEWVIYYSKAYEFLHALPGDVQSEAEDQVADCHGDSYIDLDRHVTLVVYWALQSLIMDAVQEMLDKEKAA